MLRPAGTTASPRQRLTLFSFKKVLIRRSPPPRAWRGLGLLRVAGLFRDFVISAYPNVNAYASALRR